MPQSKKPSESCLLIYDGECRMCMTAKRGLERLAIERDIPSIRMVAYQSREAEEALGPEYRPGRPGVAFLVRPNGDIARGLDAFFPLLPGLTGGRLLAALFQVPLVKPLGHLLYRLIARYRYRLFGAVPLAGSSSGPGGTDRPLSPP